MAESIVSKIGDNVRPESLKKNIYKVNSPYDLTADIVTKSLNVLQSFTGYDYRTNPTLDIIERLVDEGSGSSNLTSIGAERLIIEFQRRALTRNFDQLIPTPTDLIPNFKKFFKDTEYKKTDAYITDPLKNPNKSVAASFLENTIGYIDNQNYLTGIYKFANVNVSVSDLNYFYSGDMIKEKILQLNQNSVFSTYNVKNTSKIEFDNQSLVFVNTYSFDFINENPDNNKGLYEYDNSGLNDIYTKSYFKNYPIEDGSLTKDYIKEAIDRETNQGFGAIDNEKFKNRNENISLTTVNNLNDANQNALINKEDAINGGAFHYDSDTDFQGLFLQGDNKIRRGLVYFTSKLARNDKSSTIPQDIKQLYLHNKGDDKALYWKGNGSCRTFTVYDQYDNYNKLIRFDGNNEKNSVLSHSVLPKIAPYKNDEGKDKHKYFFTMENLAVKVTDNDNCDKGPNGGSWMWFVPYDVKISDNNSVNWSEINFLGRPEPIYSYQNSKRSLSLSFRLLIDTVSDIKKVEPTIQNYYNYLYACNDIATSNQLSQTQNTINLSENIIPKNEVKEVAEEERYEGNDYELYFKNDEYVVEETRNGIMYFDFTANDSCFENIEGNKINDRKFYVSGLTGDTILGINYFNNVDFKNLSYTAATEWINKKIKTSKKLEITIDGNSDYEFSAKYDKNNQNDVETYGHRLCLKRAFVYFRNYIYPKLDNIGTVLITDDKDGKEKYDIVNDYEKILGDNKTSQLTGSWIDTLDDYTEIEGKAKVGDCEITIYFSSGWIRFPIDPTKTFAKRNDISGGRPYRNARISSMYATPKDSVDTRSKAVIEKESKPVTQQAVSNTNIPNRQGEACDPELNLKFARLEKQNKFPIGFQKLNTFTPAFNSQTPFDFTKRYVFLHQLTRPSNLNLKGNSVENTVFGRMPVFVLRYGDFLHTKAIANSINFDITESTWDLNPEGMGAIPIMCNVTMDLTLIGGQSLAGPLDKIQTADDSGFIANTTFNTGRYQNNKRFKDVRDDEKGQYPDKASGKADTKASSFVDKTTNFVPPAFVERTKNDFTASVTTPERASAASKESRTPNDNKPKPKIPDPSTGGKYNRVGIIPKFDPPQPDVFPPLPSNFSNYYGTRPISVGGIPPPNWKTSMRYNNNDRGFFRRLFNF